MKIRPLFLPAVLLASTALFGAVETGSIVPELNVREWIKGGNHTLKENRGKTVVLMLWTMSQQGSADFEKVSRLAADFGEKKYCFLSVCCDGPAGIKRFFRLKDLKIPVAADNTLKTTNTYMRSTDRIPMFAVISPEGKLLWRGPFAGLKQTLLDLGSGKYDLKATIERDRFVAAVAREMNIQNYPAVVQLITEELVRNPENPELIALKAKILAFQLKKMPEALAFLRECTKKKPHTVQYHELAYRLLLAKKMTGKELTEALTFLTEDCKEKPLVLVEFARQELAPQQDQPRLENALLLINAAKKAPKFASAREEGIVYNDSARILYYCGRPDLAAEDARKTVKLFKGTKDFERAKRSLLYYQNVTGLSRRLGPQK